MTTYLIVEETKVEPNIHRIISLPTYHSIGEIVEINAHNFKIIGIVDESHIRDVENGFFKFHPTKMTYVFS